MELVIVDTNLQKIQELKNLLKTFPFFDIFSLRDFPDCPVPQTPNLQQGPQVAKEIASVINRHILMDISGLVIPALNSEPGEEHPFFQKDSPSDTDQLQELLVAMQMMEDMKRHAYFVCNLILAKPQKVLKQATATCEGFIVKEPRGNNGFGFDPLFSKHDYDKTFAELDFATKNRVSHRRKAFDRIAGTLESLDDRL